LQPGAPSIAPAAWRRPAGPARRRGATFFKSKFELLEHFADRPWRDGNAQPITQLHQRGVGILPDKLGQLLAIDLAATRAAAFARDDLATLASMLFEPSHPGGTDRKGLGDLLGLPPCVAGGNYPLP